MTCGCNDKCELPKALQINNPGEVTLFHRVDIPASQGDDTTYPPKNGLYRNVLLVYLANNHSYLYNSDGIPTRVDGPAGPGTAAGGETGQVLAKRSDADYDTTWVTQTSANDATLTISRNDTPVGTFTANASVDKTIDIEVPTKTSDLTNDGATGESTYAEATDIADIWEEIEEIEAASDVTDVVGTYAELEAYDTSKLKDNDIIKVLEDETQNDQITYYRWDTETETFTLIGAIGPYYTKSEADTTFQGKLTAGSNITIDANNEISATDTTYSDFTGATSSVAGAHGLVPAPTTSDPDKFLKGDGTWGTPPGTTYTAGEGIEINSNTIAAKVREVYNHYTSRPTTANTTPTGNGGMFTFQATSSMTTGKPKNDSHILQLEWDDTTGFDSQIALSRWDSPHWMGYRTQSNGTWGNWVYLLNDTAGSVKTANLDALAVTTAKIADGAVTEAKINATDWAKKVNVASIDLTGETTTLLSLAKALGTNNIDYARWECRTNVGSANISDKPTGGVNASFVCEAYCNRWTASNDYRYQLICWVNENTNPFVAYIADTSSSITWERLRPTVNDATLTIQKNGTTVETFTANSSTNKTANITVPTKTSDLTNDGSDGTSTYVEATDLNPGDVSGEGTSITLPGTQGGRFSEVKLKGDTEQATYSGKNLLNEAGIEQITRSGITVTYNAANSTITINGTATARADFGLPSLPTTEANVLYAFSYWYISGSGTCEVHYQDGSHSWQGYNIDNASTSDRGFSMSFDTSMTFDTKILRIQSGTTCSNLTFHLQFEKSSTVTPYEPYVGGAPSPSPSYPQTVQTATGEQTIAITGKNLCNGISQGYWLNAATDNAGVTSNDTGLIIPVAQNTDYTISTTATQARYRIAFSDQVWGGSQFTCYNGQNSDNTSASITKNSGTHKYLVVNATDLTKIQVEKGSAATTYESYHGQTYTINLGTTELCKIGDSQDYIYKSNGTWYLHKVINKKVFTGSEYWAYESAYHSFRTTGVFSDIKDYNAYSDHFKTFEAVSDYYVPITWDEMTYNHVGMTFLTTSSTYNVLSLYSTETSVNNFKTWLNTHNVTIYYQLATPTDTPITGTLLDELNAFDQATSYQGNTYITVSSVSPDLPATLSVVVEQESALPVATETSVGVVSVGDGLEVTDGGVLSLADNVVYSEDPGTPIEPPVVELFSGSANGDVTLSERIDNFAYVEIFGEEVGGRKVYVKLLSPATSDKFVFGALFFSQSYNTTYLRSCLYTISSDALTLLQTDASTIEFKTSGTTNSIGTSTYVKKVIGYRYM